MNYGHDKEKDMFLSRISHIDRDTSCWIWERPSNRDRGAVRINGVRWLASRLSWFLFCGPIPDGSHILHRCDNPRCVNPTHLFPGSHADNMADKKAKGRAHRLPGESHPLAKITDETAREIYDRVVNRNERSPEVARHFGVNYHTVRKIATGKQWRDATSGLRR